MFDIHVIAVNQKSSFIRDWMVKIVGSDEVIAMIHRRVDDDRFQVSKEFGEKVFDTFHEARDFIGLELANRISQAC
jgi:hypothetical protein